MAQERAFTKHQPAKKHKGTKEEAAREAEEQKVVRKHVYGHELVYFALKL